MQARASRRRACQPGRGCKRLLRQGGELIHAEVSQPDAASGVAPMRGEQAGFECEQAQGVRGLDAQLRHGAGVGVQAGGQIHRQHRLLAGVDQADPVGHATVGLAHLGADAQQGIDAQIKRVGRRLREGDASLQRALVRRSSICWRRVCAAEPGEHRLLAPALQVHGGFQPVAAVVAGAAGDPDALGVRRQGERQLRHGQPGAGNQAVSGQGGLCRLLHGACGRHVEQGVAGSEVYFLHRF